MDSDKNSNNSSTNNSNQSINTNQGTPSWPSINTSTSESMARLRISKSREFEKIIKKHPKN